MKVFTRTGSGGEHPTFSQHQRSEVAGPACDREREGEGGERERARAREQERESKIESKRERERKRDYHTNKHTLKCKLQKHTYKVYIYTSYTINMRI